jgi:outer membrane protein OmpA-like peptidoglycan-associated protein
LKVKSILLQHGVSAQRITIFAAGEKQPRFENSNATFRLENRRVVASLKLKSNEIVVNKNPLKLKYWDNIK